MNCKIYKNLLLDYIIFSLDILDNKNSDILKNILQLNIFKKILNTITKCLIIYFYNTSIIIIKFHII